MVGAVVAQHLATPCEDLIRLLAIDDHAEIPDAQVFERWIEFASEEGFFEMEVALDRIDGGRRIGVGHRVALLDGDCVFQADRQRKPPQWCLGNLVTRLPDVAVDLHRLTVFATIGAVGDRHHHQELVGREHLIDQFLLRFALLGEGRQPPRGGLE